MRHGGVRPSYSSPVELLLLAVLLLIGPGRVSGGSAAPLLSAEQHAELPPAIAADAALLEEDWAQIRPFLGPQPASEELLAPALLDTAHRFLLRLDPIVDEAFRHPDLFITPLQSPRPQGVPRDADDPRLLAPGKLLFTALDMKAHCARDQSHYLALLAIVYGLPQDVRHFCLIACAQRAVTFKLSISWLIERALGKLGTEAALSQWQWRAESTLALLKFLQYRHQMQSILGLFAEVFDSERALPILETVDELALTGLVNQLREDLEAAPWILWPHLSVLHGATHTSPSSIAPSLKDIESLQGRFKSENPDYYLSDSLHLLAHRIIGEVQGGGNNGVGFAHAVLSLLPPLVRYLVLTAPIDALLFHWSLEMIMDQLLREQYQSGEPNLEALDRLAKDIGRYMGFKPSAVLSAALRGLGGKGLDCEVQPELETFYHQMQNARIFGEEIRGQTRALSSTFAAIRQDPEQFKAGQQADTLWKVRSELRALSNDLLACFQMLEDQVGDEFLRSHLLAQFIHPSLLLYITTAALEAAMAPLGCPPPGTLSNLLLSLRLVVHPARNPVKKARQEDLATE